MSDLIRSQVESNNSRLIKYQVQDNTNNDKLIRHQVMGIGGGSAPVLESLSVTENGTYTPETGVDGFNNVNVNVQGILPDEQLISEFDFTSATPFYDVIRKRDCDVSEQKGGTLTTSEGVGLTLDSRPAYFKTFIGMNWNCCYKIVVKFGSLNFTGGDTSGNKCIISFDSQGNSNEGGSLDWNLANNVFKAYSSAGWVTGDTNKNLTNLENKTLTIYFGVSFIEDPDNIGTYIMKQGQNGRRFYYFDENNEPIIGGYSGFASNDFSRISQLGLGATNSNSFMGATFESLKVYKLNNLEMEV